MVLSTIVTMQPRRCNPTSLRERIKVLKERAEEGDFLSPKETMLRFVDVYEELVAMLDELDRDHPELEPDSQ